MWETVTGMPHVPTRNFLIMVTFFSPGQFPYNKQHHFSARYTIVFLLLYFFTFSNRENFKKTDNE